MVFGFENQILTPFHSYYWLYNKSHVKIDMVKYLYLALSSHRKSWKMYIKDLMINPIISLPVASFIVLSSQPLRTKKQYNIV